MTKRFWMLLLCLLLVCSCALAECAICGGDSVCDTCLGNGYLLMQAYGSDEEVKVACTGGCDNGRCPTCAPPCDVCGSDGKCDVCEGLGYLLMQAYDSSEDVKVACTGENCADGACAACVQAEAEPESTPAQVADGMFLSATAEHAGMDEAKLDEPYVFAHSVSEKRIRGKLGKTKGETVTRRDLLQITELDLSFDSPIDYLDTAEDVRYLLNLEKLDLSVRDITDLSPLAGLTKLRVLDLSSNKFTDLSPLAALTELEVLDLMNCEGIEDFAVLSSLTKLHTLYLSGGRIEDISVLSSLKNLKDLSLSETLAADLSPLEDMTQLEKLNIAGIAASEWEHLTSLGNLKELHIGYVQEGDLRPVSKLKQLTALHLYDTNMSDIGPLAELVNLTYLNLDRNEIVDVSPLATMSQLQKLSLVNNQVEDVSPLAGLKELVELNLYGNNVSDASPLDALPALEELILTKNPVSPKDTSLSAQWNTSIFATPAPTRSGSPIAGWAEKVRKNNEQSGNTLTIEVFIGDDHRKYTITTDETYVLDALLEANLIEGEDVSWGFNVTIVDGVKANYNKKGEYWSILEYVNGSYQSLMDSLGARVVEDGDRYAFRLMN